MNIFLFFKLLNREVRISFINLIYVSWIKKKTDCQALFWPFNPWKQNKINTVFMQKWKAFTMMLY